MLFKIEMQAVNGRESKNLLSNKSTLSKFKKDLDV